MGWFRDLRRRRALKNTEVDESLWRATLDGLPFLKGLHEDELARLRDLAVLFLHEKEMHGAGDFQLDDRIRLSIAVQACVPILNLGLDFYDGWVGVIVYPGEFRVTMTEVDEDGVVHEFEDELSGEAWPGGPVVLSWEDASQSETGYNVVIHEFAHKIHMQREDADGYPLPHADMDATEWRRVLDEGYERLCRQVDSGRATLVDEYAAEHPAEFFAVMSEMFFTDSAVLARDWRELYLQLSRFYRQDPAGVTDA